ncbi:MAG TPA: NAD(+) diphosphatase [Polyangiales bacterium]
MPEIGRFLDRAAHRRKDLDFLEAQLGAGHTRVLPLWREQHLLVGDELFLPRLRDAGHWLDAGGELVWLGERGSEAYFALDISALDAPLARPAPEGATELSDLLPLLMRLPHPQIELAFFARAILLWHARHRYCGSCGRPTKPRQGGHLRVCSGSECGAQHFPRTDPCVLVLVTDGDRCLLGRQREWPNGMYSALAGFVEPGEMLEQAAAREVLEETSVQIGELSYVGSQPWPFPTSLMVGFSAPARSTEIRLADAELEDARWVSREQLRAGNRPDFFVPPPLSLAGRLLNAFTTCAPAPAWSPQR